MSTKEVTYPDVTVKLAGEDGNAWAIMGAVANGIKAVHGREAAEAYRKEAMDSPSYDELLTHAMTTVNVE